jgi:hypothetical protein
MRKRVVCNQLERSARSDPTRLDESVRPEGDVGAADGEGNRPGPPRERRFPRLVHNAQNAGQLAQRSSAVIAAQDLDVDLFARESGDFLDRLPEPHARLVARARITIRQTADFSGKARSVASLLESAEILVLADDRSVGSTKDEVVVQDLSKELDVVLLLGGADRDVQVSQSVSQSVSQRCLHAHGAPHCRRRSCVGDASDEVFRSNR